MGDDNCKTKRNLFARLSGGNPSEHFTSYDGRLDGALPDTSSLLSDVPLLRRTDIVVTGDPARVQKLGDAVVTVQKSLAANPNQQVDMRVTAFMDDCMHTTGWSTRPVDVRDQLSEWHCFESETQLVNAFRATAEEHARRGRIDSVVIIANRFDEPLREVQAAARPLASLGIHIHALVISKAQKLLAQYKAVTDLTKGHSVAIGSVAAIKEAMPILIFSMFPNTRMRELPAPKDPGVLQLAGLLAAPRR